MPQATAIQNTKKQAPPARRPPSVKPHRDLTPTQDEVADLASDLIMNGGSQQDLSLFLRALLRHEYRKHGFGKKASTDHIDATVSQWLDRSSQRIMKQWPDPIEGSNVEGVKPKTVVEMAQANVRRELKDQFAEFLAREDGLEPIWLLNDILTYCTSAGYDLAEAFAVVMDADDIYVRVPWSQADKVRAFVKLLDDGESN
jgi:hypothetical protein